MFTGFLIGFLIGLIIVGYWVYEKNREHHRTCRGVGCSNLLAIWCMECKEANWTSEGKKITDYFGESFNWCSANLQNNLLINLTTVEDCTGDAKDVCKKFGG